MHNLKNLQFHQTDQWSYLGFGPGMELNIEIGKACIVYAHVLIQGNILYIWAILIYLQEDIVHSYNWRRCSKYKRCSTVMSLYHNLNIVIGFIPYHVIKHKRKLEFISKVLLFVYDNS